MKRVNSSARFLRRLRMARILRKHSWTKSPPEKTISIVDLRQPIDIEAFPQMIPGALRIAAEELEQRHQDIPRDKDVILFCACPNEVTAARMALILKRKGITRVRPLAGGIDMWRQLDYPLEMVASKDSLAVTAAVADFPPLHANPLATVEGSGSGSSVKSRSD